MSMIARLLGVLGYRRSLDARLTKIERQLESLMKAQAAVLEAQAGLVGAARTGLQSGRPSPTALFLVAALSVGTVLLAWGSIEANSRGDQLRDKAAELRERALDTVFTSGSPESLEVAAAGLEQADRAARVAQSGQRDATLLLVVSSSLLGGLISWLVTVLATAGWVTGKGNRRRPASSGRDQEPGRGGQDRQDGAWTPGRRDVAVEVLAKQVGG